MKPSTMKILKLQEPLLPHPTLRCPMPPALHFQPPLLSIHWGLADLDLTFLGSIPREETLPGGHISSQTLHFVH